MADSSLDDFFAKKDKSKKARKKYSTPEDIAKKLEESGKQGDALKKEKEKTGAVPTVAALKILEQDNEEWKDFEDEREKDYSGLRIQALNLKDKEEELRDQKLQEIELENKRDDVTGPWKVNQPSPVPEPVVEEKFEEKNKDESIGGRYIPPALRNKQQTTVLEPIQAKRILKSAPQINNESEFPSLGLPPPSDTKGGFQMVKHGSKEVSSPVANAALSIENKYQVLASSERNDGSSND